MVLTCDHQCDVGDRDLILLSHRENDRVGGVVVPHDPDRESGEVLRVYELPQGLARAPDGEVGVVLLSEVALVDETRNHVAVLDAEVVVRAVDVRGDDGGEVAAVLLIVAPVHYVNHTLRVSVSNIGAMWRAVVNHRFIDRVGGFVWEDARRETGDEFTDLKLLAELHHVVVNQHVLPIELNLEREVAE